METHISKELAEWLRVRDAYYIPAEYVYAWNFKNPNFITMEQLSKEVHEKELVKPGSGGGWCARAYSWYDILVTHAKEFWGDDESISSYCYCGAHRDTTEVIDLLKHRKFAEAEAYVRQHSLFAKQS